MCSELQDTEPEVRPPLGGGALDFQAVPTIQEEQVEEGKPVSKPPR